MARSETDTRERPQGSLPPVRRLGHDPGPPSRPTVAPHLPGVCAASSLKSRPWAPARPSPAFKSPSPPPAFGPTPRARVGRCGDSATHVHVALGPEAAQSHALSRKSAKPDRPFSSGTPGRSGLFGLCGICCIRDAAVLCVSESINHRVQLVSLVGEPLQVLRLASGGRSHRTGNASSIS